MIVGCARCCSKGKDGRPGGVWPAPKEHANTLRCKTLAQHTRAFTLLRYPVQAGHVEAGFDRLRRGLPRSKHTSRPSYSIWARQGADFNRLDRLARTHMVFPSLRDN